MSKPCIPSEENHYLSQHVALLQSSFRHWFKRTLLPLSLGGADAARFLFHAPYAVVSHDTAKDPVFNYANQTALSLFAMAWEDFTALPSRQSAEPIAQAERQQIMEIVTRQGFYENYGGIRIGRHGRRFMIENALIWNLLDPVSGVYQGQAAMFKEWKFL